MGNHRKVNLIIILILLISTLIISAIITFCAHRVDLQITYTVDKPTAVEQEYVFYIITLTNKGPSNATDIIISDVLPKGLTYISNSTKDSTYDENHFNPSTGIWNVSNLVRGTNTQLFITMYVDIGTSPQTITSVVKVMHIAQPESSTENKISGVSIKIE